MSETEAERLKAVADERSADERTTKGEAWEPGHIDEDASVPTTAGDFFELSKNHALLAAQWLASYIIDSDESIDLDDVEEQLVNARTALLMARGMESAEGGDTMSDTDNGTDESQPEDQDQDELEPGEGQTIEPEREGEGPTSQPGPAGTPGAPSQTPQNPAP